MNLDSHANLNQLPEEVLAEIEQWIKKYPSEHKRSALLEALKIVQQRQGGYLTEAGMNAVADYLMIPRVEVYGVATFYSLYDLQPTGRHKIYFCASISCMLCGSDQLLAYTKAKLGIDLDQTTTDGRFTLKRAECLAACTQAPMMQIDGQYYENLTQEKIDIILNQFD